MKKALFILLASGLLIGCMAGSALAGFDIEVQDVNGNVVSIGDDIQVHVGETVYLTPVFSYDGRVSSIVAPNKGTYTLIKNAVIGNAANIALTGPAGLNFILPNTGVKDSIFKDTQTVDGKTVGVIKLQVNGGTVGDKYAITIQGNDGIYVGTAVVTAVAVPEFPTVALPVAAILGLIFVFGRKKGDL